MNQWIVVVGILFLILAGGTFVYHEKTTDSWFGGLFEDTDIEYPYRAYAFPMLIVGIGLIIAGAFIPRKKS